MAYANWSPEEGIAVFRMRAAGLSLAEIADHLPARTQGGVRALLTRLRQSGIPIPLHAGRQRVVVDRAQALEMREWGWSLERIGSEMQCSPERVRAVLEGRGR